MGKYKRCENTNNTGGNMTLQMLHDKYFIFSKKIYGLPTKLYYIRTNEN